MQSTQKDMLLLEHRNTSSTYGNMNCRRIGVVTGHCGVVVNV